MLANFLPSAVSVKRRFPGVNKCATGAVSQVPLPAAEPVRSKRRPPDAATRVLLFAGNSYANQGRSKRRYTGAEQVFVFSKGFVRATAATETKNVQRKLCRFAALEEHSFVESCVCSCGETCDRFLKDTYDDFCRSKPPTADC